MTFRQAAFLALSVLGSKLVGVSVKQSLLRQLPKSLEPLPLRLTWAAPAREARLFSYSWCLLRSCRCAQGFTLLARLLAIETCRFDIHGNMWCWQVFDTVQEEHKDKKLSTRTE